MTFLINSPEPERIAIFRAALEQAFPEMTVVSGGESYDPEAVRQIFTWLPVADWSRLPNLEILFSVSAGIDQFAALPAHVKLVRMVDPHNTRRVVEYVLGACLACLRGLPAFGWQQRNHQWEEAPVRLCAGTRVGILGLGEIGCAAAAALTGLGFAVSGWSRRAKTLPMVNCYAGDAGLNSLLAESDILVCLLPLTSDTKGILERSLFSRMKTGAGLVHVGRGAHCNMDDLKAALTTGQISNAIVDVFEQEPLPADNPAWDLPNCLVTPHVAGRIDTQTSLANVLENLRRDRDGEDLLWQVDRTVGY